MPTYLVTDDYSDIQPPFTASDCYDASGPEDAAERYAEDNFSLDDIDAEVYVVDIDDASVAYVVELTVDDDYWRGEAIDTVEV